MEVLTSTQHLNTLLKTNLAGKFVQAAMLLRRQLRAQLSLHVVRLPQQRSLVLSSGFPRWFMPCGGDRDCWSGWGFAGYHPLSALAGVRS